MAVKDQKITDRYAIYNGDCIEVVGGLKDESIHVSVYSPPFAELYNYSSDERDLSNCRDYDEFLVHYNYLVEEIARVTMSGRISCVHCMDLRITGSSTAGLRDFPGDIIRMYQKNGFAYQSRHVIWKEPLRMAIKTRALGLRHGQIVKDSSKCHAAGSDFLLVFRKGGENKIPISHGHGLSDYAGGDSLPHAMVQKYTGWNDPRTNKMSHEIWRRYASGAWYDIRIKNCVEFKGGRDSEDEKHICPLQLDVIERCLTLYSNPGEVMLTPFLGVGSEVVSALKLGRRGIGAELKTSYYKQAVKNIEHSLSIDGAGEMDLFSYACKVPE